MQLKANIDGKKIEEYKKYWIIPVILIIVIISVITLKSYALFSYNGTGKHTNNIVTGEPLTPITIPELVAKANPKDLDFNTATEEQKKEMWTHEQPVTIETTTPGTGWFPRPTTTYSLGTENDYRYIGANPNNYIRFNNELWRIIGAFNVDDGTGNKELKIKIMRYYPITSHGADGNLEPFAFTSTQESIWSQGDLQNLLNNGPYYNRTKGTCITITGEGPCDFTTTGLTEEAKSLIVDSVYYFGGASINPGITNSGTTIPGTAENYYKYERQVITNAKPSPRTWTGKLGLIYPSDFGFATSGGETVTRTECLASDLLSGMEGECLNNNWIVKNPNYPDSGSDPMLPELWTILAIDNENVFGIDHNGVLVQFSAQFQEALVFPTAYLKSDIKLLGTGSISRPYEIVK